MGREKVEVRYHGRPIAVGVDGIRASLACPALGRALRPPTPAGPMLIAVIAGRPVADVAATTHLSRLRRDQPAEISDQWQGSGPPSPPHRRPEVQIETSRATRTKCW